MSRSKWKGPYINLINFKPKKNKKIQEISRNFEVTPRIVGFTFKIYNGKNFSSITINDKMIGHKLGEFVPTRARFEFKKKK